MSNTYSPTIKNLLYTELKRGDIISAHTQIGVIVDILRSDVTDNVCVYIAFAHNIGNSRQYDTIELTPERARAFGVDRWTMATKEELAEAIARRRKTLEDALQAVAVLGGVVEQ